MSVSQSYPRYSQSPRPGGGEPLQEGPRNTGSKSMRKGVACRRCHAQKVKCNGTRPCRNCEGSKQVVECIYPVRDKRVTVSESYIRMLEAELSIAKGKGRSPEKEARGDRLLSNQGDEPSPPLCLMRELPEATASSSAVIENTTVPMHESESIITDENANQFLNEMSIQPSYVGEAACTTFGSKFRQFLLDKDAPPPIRRARYHQDVKMLRASCTDCDLPNRSDAQLLARVVLRFVGAEYHLLRRKSFLERLDETYRLSTLDDPIWLCRLFTVFALGEVYSVRPSQTVGPSIPGITFFVKAIEFFQDLYEEPTLEYIETLLLLSFYSVTLNRRNTAYTYIGLALRLSLMLSLHRKVKTDTTLTPAQREHRVRVWWTVYCLDRLMSSKMGHPIMIQDKDIDTQMPSMDGLSADDMQDFFDPSHLIAQIQLSRITGNVLSNIYYISQPGRVNTFIQGVQRTLTSLRSFHEALPPLLRLSQSSPLTYANRSVASLHLHFNQCVILTTRPVLFYVFRTRFMDFSHELSATSQSISPMTAALAEACVQAARVSNQVLSQLWVDNCLACYGFYDAVSIFSSTLILIISSAMKTPQTDSDADGIGTAWSIMRSMRDGGNIPASDYYDQLIHLKQDLEEACATRKHLHRQSPLNGAAITTTNNSELATQSMLAPNQSILQAGIPSSNDALNDPSLYEFLTQPQASWDPNAFDSMLSSISGVQGSW